MISEILPVFSRKPIFGYKAIAFSTLAIAFFSMLVWAHHMFTTGLGTGLDSFFMISSMLIAVPTGIKIFNWVATMWRGNLIFDTPMLYALGFLALFTIGGLTGIFLAAFPVDWQLHDTLLRRRALPLRRLRRERRSRSSPASTTGGRRCSGACSTSGSASCTSGSCSSAST